MTANIDPVTGIAYGYISANCLDADILHDLLYVDGEDYSYREAVKEAQEQHEWENKDNPDDEGFDEQEFADRYESYEPIIGGKLCNGVTYQTSWLGGALNLWIFSSPFITDKARRASPCVPNAGILDELDGSVTAYDVPDDWRRKED